MAQHLDNEDSSEDCFHFPVKAEEALWATWRGLRCQVCQRGHRDKFSKISIDCESWSWALSHRNAQTLLQVVGYTILREEEVID